MKRIFPGCAREVDLYWNDIYGLARSIEDIQAATFVAKE
jgi:hypothetical protein